MKIYTLYRALLVFLFSTLLFSDVLGDTRFFTGTGNFGDAAHWDGSTLPQAGDNLIIDGICVVEDNAVTNGLLYGTLTIGNLAQATLQWPAGGTNILNVTNVSSSAGTGHLDMTNGGTLVIRGTWSSGNLNFTPGTGTIEIRSAMALPATYRTYNNLSIGTTVAVSAPATLNITGNFTLNAGTFTAGANINISGNWTRASGANFSPSTGTVTFNGSGAQSINGSNPFQTFNNLVVSKPAGSLLSVSGSTTTITTNNFLQTSGDFTAPANMNVNGSLTITAGLFLNNGLLYVKGNIINHEPAMEAGTGTLYLNGATAQAIGGSQTLKTFNLVTDNLAGITLNNNLSVSGSHTFSAGLITTSATPNYLVYESGSSYSGDNDNRHINGWVKKIGHTNFIFPVGNNLVERTVGVINLSSASEINVGYAAATPNYGNAQWPLMIADSYEYWVINKVSGGSANIALNWDNNKVTMPNYQIADIRAAYYNGSLWTDAGGSATGDITSTGNITSNYVSSFGLFTFGSQASVLPLNFLGISAFRKIDHNLVEWKTSNEFNCDHFEVEHSVDGLNFSKAGVVNTKNSPGIHLYSFKDLGPVTGTVWYRVRGVDIDGKYTISKVVMIYDRVRGYDGFTMINPAHNEIILLPGNKLRGPFNYRLYGNDGRLIKHGSFVVQSGGSNSIALPSNVLTGIYVLQVSNTEVQFNYKVMIK